MASIIPGLDWSNLPPADEVWWAGYRDKVEAAAREARIVLADEPTAELDEDNEQIVLTALRRLRDEFGSTVIVVTHARQVTDAMDRVIEIRDGRAVR